MDSDVSPAGCAETPVASPAPPGDHPEATATSEAPALRPGAEKVGDKVYLRNAKGSLDPIELVRAQHLIEDELVRDLYERAQKVAAAIAEFKALAFAEIDTFNEVLASVYESRAGGAKGNISLTSYDGLIRVQVQVADQITFGAELQQAKTLVDECIEEWSADSRAEIRKLVMDAFDVDREGNINRGKLFSLLRLEITDERWLRGMKAIRDSIKVTGSKRYIRLHRRPDQNARFEQLSLDAATA